MVLSYHVVVGQEEVKDAVKGSRGIREKGERRSKLRGGDDVEYGNVGWGQSAETNKEHPPQIFDEPQTVSRWSLPIQMSSSAAVFSVSTSTAVEPRRTTRTGVLIASRLSLPSPSSSPFIGRRPIQSINHGRSTATTFKPRRSTVLMDWQDCTVKMEIDVPISVAYNCYLDREAIPRWMPFISSVKILEDKPDLSRWSLKYKAFGRDLEFSWLARNMQPIPNQKIHWRSLEGLPNRGAVRFFPKGSSSCLVELTVSYEVPQLLSPVASALQPFLENLLGRGLEQFAKYARTYQPDSA
ncbi:hypothetical protein SSX86_026967 [Deinandra increscens subsp. villosa]|uniref:Coenzyme Q-binding protein COQ10 START domain-containing protein n=1 Tax=Deinandra increscens subsp. villosa TaxID=3103831 RepID=A0AAP0CKU7_9ASTR